MGFRDFTQFNKALLTKQVWRIVENPNALVARILKARYFKHLDIMEASIGNNPLFIWRSLMWSKDLLHNGTIWKIGDGATINARRDSWIPSIASGKVSSSVFYDSNVTLNCLFTEDMTWDIPKLNASFLPFEVEAILKVPIARYWRWKKKGTYTVKSGYWSSYFTAASPDEPNEGC